MTKVSPLRVCVLQSSYEGSDSAMKDWDDFDCSPDLFFKDPSYLFESVKITKAKAYARVRELVLSGRYDVFLNLCDGAKDEDRAGSEVILALEDFGAAYTGIDYKNYEPTKIHMKQALFGRGVLFPNFAHIYKGDDIAKEVAHLKMPVLVKHPSGYSSIHMSEKSKCTTLEDLIQQVMIFFETTGEVLVEEFIEGREVTVLALEDSSQVDGVFMYEPVEVRFPKGQSFKHFDMKWVDHGEMAWKPLESTEKHLKEAIRSVGKEAFLAVLKGIGYGRSDLRIDKDGRVYFLEINPNCGIFYPESSFGSADYILHSSEDGVGGFTKKIIQAAFSRRGKRNSLKGLHRISYHPEKGFYLRAQKHIAEGSLVFSYEQSPFYLVSKNHVQTSWPQTEQELFSQYAWPLSEHVFVVWSEDPKDWKPINHSCEPNLWLADRYGLDVYARVDIPAGAELTIDYATFVAGPSLAAFSCSCSSLNCRKRISPTDFAASPKLQEVYGKRVTDFVYNGRSTAYDSKPTERDVL